MNEIVIAGSAIGPYAVMTVVVTSSIAAVMLVGVGGVVDEQELGGKELEPHPAAHLGPLITLIGQGPRRRVGSQRRVWGGCPPRQYRACPRPGNGTQGRPEHRQGIRATQPRSVPTTRSMSR